MKKPDYMGCDCGGEHYPTAAGRAWCLDCTEWCYPTSKCEVQELRDFAVYAAVHSNDPQIVARARELVNVPA